MTDVKSQVVRVAMPDVRTTLRKMLYGLSGDNPADDVVTRFLVRPGERVIDRWEEPEELPRWLTEDDLEMYARAYETDGFTSALNFYRNLASHPVQEAEHGQCGGVQDGRRVASVGRRAASAERTASGQEHGHCHGQEEQAGFCGACSEAVAAQPRP